MSIVSETATLAHGYTMADVDNIARLAAHYRPTRLIDTDEVFAIAWHGVVEALYTMETEPSRYELVAAGTRALSVEWKRQVSYQGLNQGRSRDQTDAAPQFEKYWRSLQVADDFTDRIVERLALPTLLATLTPKEYEAISTLAAFDGDTHAAAQALGMRRDAFSANATRARRRLEALWYEHETPRSKRSNDPAKCRNGHSRAEHGYRDVNAGWLCAMCMKSTRRRADRRFKARKKAEALAAAG